jgi:2'-5' RNA ligase
MHRVQYDFSSVHVDVPPVLAMEIMEWGQQVSDEDIYVTQSDPTFGREDEIHITILYGLHTDNPEQLRKLLERSGPVNVTLGKIEVFTNPQNYDVVMIEAHSRELHDLNVLLKEKTAHSSRFPLYQPHVTIAYVKKGRGWEHRGLDQWEGTQFMCHYAVFSSRNGGKYRISL